MLVKKPQRKKASRTTNAGKSETEINGPTHADPETRPGARVGSNKGIEKGKPMEKGNNPARNMHNPNFSGSCFGILVGNITDEEMIEEFQIPNEENPIPEIQEQNTEGALHL